MVGVALTALRCVTRQIQGGGAASDLIRRTGIVPGGGSTSRYVLEATLRNGWSFTAQAAGAVSSNAGAMSFVQEVMAAARRVTGMAAQVHTHARTHTCTHARTLRSRRPSPWVLPGPLVRSAPTAPGPFGRRVAKRAPGAQGPGPRHTHTHTHTHPHTHTHSLTLPHSHPDTDTHIYTHAHRLWSAPRPGVM